MFKKYNQYNSTVIKKNLFLIGLGKNQTKIIKNIDIKNFKIIAIDKKISKKLNNKFLKHHKISIYDYKNANELAKQLIKQKIKIHAVIYRSSGAAILTARILEKNFKIKRIDRILSNCIFSKYYFYKFLKKNKIEGLKSKVALKYFYVSKKQNLLIKPDSPIKGKKNVYFFLNKKIKNDNFLKSHRNSFNKKVNISTFYEGRDISTFYLVDNNKRKIRKISHVEEINKFNKKGYLQNLGVCSPVYSMTKSILKKKENIDKKIVKLFPSFYGIVSISSKVTKKGVYPYEINIGLSGDRYADKIFPSISLKSLYKIDLNICLFKKFSNLSIIKNKFCGYFNNKKITNPKIFYKLINQNKI